MTADFQAALTERRYNPAGSPSWNCWWSSAWSPCSRWCCSAGSAVPASPPPCNPPKPRSRAWSPPPGPRRWPADSLPACWFMSMPRAPASLCATCAMWPCNRRRPPAGRLSRMRFYPTAHSWCRATSRPFPPACSRPTPRFPGPRRMARPCVRPRCAPTRSFPKTSTARRRNNGSVSPFPPMRARRNRATSSWLRVKSAPPAHICPAIHRSSWTTRKMCAASRSAFMACPR